MKNLLTVTSLSGLLWLLQACSSTPELTENQAMEAYPEVAELQQNLQKVDSQQLSLLSQDHFNKAQEGLTEARKLALANDSDAIKVAEQAQDNLEWSEDHAQLASNTFEEVLAARNNVIEQGLSDADSKELREIDEDFKELTLAYEKGDDSAKTKRPEMIQRYNGLQLDAIKTATVEDARAALKRAEKAGAPKYATKTFKSAKNELNLATGTLESDVSRQGKAMEHANQAVWEAERSMSITDSVKEFEENDFTKEDIVLWYQQQLVKVTAATGQPLPLNKANHNLVNEAAASVAATAGQNEELELALAASDQRYADAVQAKKTELSAMEMTYTDAERMRSERAKAAKESERLFSENEASIYLQQDNVLIRAHGFWFRSGDSEIDARNFALLKKIEKTIEKFC